MRKAAAIDTQLLVLLVVGLTDPDFISRHKRTRDYDVFNFQQLFEFVVCSSQLVCTAHILTETSNLIRQCAEPMRTRLMGTLKTLIGAARELATPAIEVAVTPEFLRLGLTDAAILSLDPEQVGIFTVDHDLHVAASARGFDVINMTPIFFG